MKKKIYIKKMNAEQSIKAKVASIAQIKIKNSVFYSVIAVFFIMFAGIGFLIFGKTYSMTTGNKGVIIKTYYSQEYFNNNKNMQMTIENNNNNSITIKKILYRNNDCIINNTTCPDYNEADVSDAVIGGGSTIIQSKTSDYIKLNSVSSFFTANKNVEVGIKYTIEGDSSEYTATSNTMETEAASSMSINSKNNDFTEEEFVFTANIPSHWTASIYPKAKMYTKLSANNIHMNIDETLDSFNLKYQLKTEWPNAYYVASPFNGDVQTANMLGQENYSNFKEYFSFTTTNTTYQSNSGFSYENMSFNILGSLKTDSTYTNITIYPSFYWCLGSKTLGSWNNKRCSGDGNDEFITDKIPQFQLTVYNKSPLKNAINSAIQKQADKSDSTIYEFASYAKYNNHIKSAIELYNGRNSYQKCDENGNNCKITDVNQEEINYYVNLLNTYEIEERPSADYSAYNTIISKIENLNSSWYETTTYNSLMTLYNEKDNYLNYNDLHQYEIDEYVSKLQSAFNDLVLLDADTTNLESAITKAEAKQNKTYTVEGTEYSLYTKTTWDNFTTALDEAKAVRNYKIDQQDAVDSATTNLETAITNLSKTSAVTTKLEAAITEAEAKQNKTYTVEGTEYSLYTKTTWDNFTAALDEAKAVRNYKIDQQEAVDTATTNLETAISSLSKTSAITTKLEAAIEEAAKKDNTTYTVGGKEYSLYTKTTWDNFTAALDEAKAVRNYTIDQQDAVDTATSNLETAITNLSKTSAVTTKLEEAITKAEAKQNTTYTVGEKTYTLYTDETWGDFTTALNAAKAVRNNTIDQQKAVDDATNALKTAIEGLKKTSAVTTKLEEAITKAGTKQNTTYTVEGTEYTLYTKATWDNFTVALDEAKAVRNYTIDQQDAVDTATTNLETAITNLSKTSAVTTKLEEAITKAEEKQNTTYTVEEKTYTLYTDETWGDFTTALNAAKAVRNNTIDQQKAVDDATNALKTAIEGLKKTSAVTTSLKAAITEANAIENKTYTVGEESYKLYTEDSWNKLTTALAKAETAKSYKIDKQADVDSATENLEKALAGLKKTSAVTTNLEAAITEAETKENKTYTVGEKTYTLYTDETWGAFTTALNTAKTVQNNTIDQQDAVNTATSALKDAIADLKKRASITTNLEAAITEATGKKNEIYEVEEKKYALYTEKTWNDMIVALTEAEAVKNYKIDRQQAVDDATTALNNAIENLVKTRGVYTNVESIVNHYNKYKDAGYYLHDNVDLDNYISAINYNLKIDEQDKINLIEKEIEGKVSSLEYKLADYSTLDKIIDDYYKSEDYVNNYYNEDDKEALEEYINNIDRTIIILDQEKVTKLEAELKTKIANLKYIPADYKKINDLISEINKLNKNNYSNFNNLEKLIDSIVYDKTIKEQDYVDKIYNQLYDSYISLKTKVPDKENSKNNNNATEQENSKNNNNATEQESTKKLSYKDLIEYITVNDNKVDMTTDNFKHKVSKYTTEAIIKVGLKNKNYKVSIDGNKKLNSGSNIYKIIIKDQKNKQYIYSLEVIKEDASNYLSNIKIIDYEIKFNKKTQSYKINLAKNIKKLSIEATPEDKDAQVIIEGNDNLENESVITIKVIATDKEERVYKIHIVKEANKEEKDSKTITPYVAAGVITTTIIGIGVYMLFIKPKKF